MRSSSPVAYSRQFGWTSEELVFVVALEVFHSAGDEVVDHHCAYFPRGN